MGRAAGSEDADDGEVGADGAGAIYTDHAAAIHILRMVILRIGTITDYLVLKLH